MTPQQAPSWKWQASSGIPNEFVLVVETDRVRAPCHVIWRRATRLGVAFNA